MSAISYNEQKLLNNIYVIIKEMGIVLSIP